MSNKYRYINRHLEGLKDDYKETGSEEVKNAIQELSEVLHKSRLYDLAMKINCKSKESK